ncbi:MAG: aspartate aminotransferase family protein [Bacteroidia bacterium]
MIKEDLQLFTSLVEGLLEEEKKEAVVKPIPAKSLFDVLDLELPEEATEPEDYANALKSLVLSTPRTATDKFFNQLFGGRNGKAVIGDLLAVLLNNSMYTYKVAGPMVGVEKVLLRKICDMIGYGPDADGTFVPGGSMANYMGMLMARDVKDPQARQAGSQPNMTMYTSAESHYSIAKNAAFVGLGRQQVRRVATNEHGQMLASDLEQQIKKDLAAGLRPFCVNATAGTTVLGAFDPIEALADVCDQYDIWLHVDGAYCGGVLWSERYKHLVQGLHRANSFSVNAHKMLGTPLSCSIIVTQDKKHLNESFSNDASYLYQTDGDDYNLGKTSLQCGRRNDALKFWTLWKAIGSKGLEKLVDKQFALADFTRDYIRKHPDYQLYSFDDSISVCFNYKNIPADTLCTQLYERGELMVGYGSFRDQQFVRLVTINPANGEDEIRAMFNIIENN